MSKTVACSNPKCGKRFAEIIGDGDKMPIVVDLVRRGNQIMTTGPMYSLTATCRFCKQRTTLMIKDGKLDETDLKFRDPKKPDVDEEETEPEVPVEPVDKPEETKLPPPEEEPTEPEVVPEAPVEKPKFTKSVESASV